MVSVSPADKQPQIYRPWLMQNGAPVGWTNLNTARGTLATSSLQCKSSSEQLTSVIDCNRYDRLQTRTMKHGAQMSQTTDKQTDRPRYTEMCSNRRNRLRCKKRFRLTTALQKGNTISFLNTFTSISPSWQSFTPGLLF